MRQPLPLTALVLIGALFAAAPARAQQPSRWVDPPAKSGQPEAPKPGEPVRPEPKSEVKAAPKARTEPEPRTAETPPRRAKAAEMRRERRISARRAADGMAMPATEAHRPEAVQEVARAPDPRLSGWVGAAQQLTSDYFDTVSSSNAEMVSSASRFYGERVRFHGRAMTRSALAAEKGRFVRRWPERSYEPRGGMRTACNAVSATCVVRTVFAYRAENPARGERALGLGELTVTVSFADERPLIVSETSRVLGRGSAAASAGERGGQGA